MKRYELECRLILITNTASHTDFRLIPTSVTSELEMDPFFLTQPNSTHQLTDPIPDPRHRHNGPNPIQPTHYR